MQQTEALTRRLLLPAIVSAVFAMNGFIKSVGQEAYRVGKILDETSHDFTSIVTIFVLMIGYPII